MSLETRDAEIARIFARLKISETGYPPHLLEARRLDFRQQVAEISLGLEVSAALKNSSNPKTGGGTSIGGIIEVVLLVAIVGETSAAAYFYRNRIVDYIRTYDITPQATETSPPSSPVSPLFNLSETNVPVSIEITPTSTISLSITPTITLSITPTFPADQTSTTGANSATGIQGISTPEPTGNNGNHFGQTPKPERTKEK